MNVELHIERLVLDGIDLPPGQRDLLRESVVDELGRLLHGGGLAGSVLSGGAVAHLRGPAVTLSAGGATADLGRQLAGAIYRGVRR